MENMIIILTVVFLIGFIIPFIFLILEIRQHEKESLSSKIKTVVQYIPYKQLIVLSKDNLFSLKAKERTDYCVQDLANEQPALDSQHFHFRKIHERFIIKETC